MKPPFILVPDNVSHDTVECLRQLLDQAKKGQVIGLAYSAMLKQRAYIVNTAGAAYESPTFAMGMTAALMHQLADRTRGGHD